PDGRADPGRGIREIVSGTGGKSLRPFVAPVPNSEVRGSSDYGVLKLTLHAAGYEWEFVPIPGGSFRDAGSGSCRAGSVANELRSADLIPPSDLVPPSSGVQFGPVLHGRLPAPSRDRPR